MYKEIHQHCKTTTCEETQQNSQYKAIKNYTTQVSIIGTMVLAHTKVQIVKQQMKVTKNDVTSANKNVEALTSVLRPDRVG